MTEEMTEALPAESATLPPTAQTNIPSDIPADIPAGIPSDAISSSGTSVPAESLLPNGSDAEAVIEKIIGTVQEKGIDGFFQKLWEHHQNDVIHLGKILLLSAVVVVLGWIFSKILRKLIFNATEKIASLDEAVGRILYSIVRVFVWLFVALIVLDLFGINTASLLTVLGAAGLTVGLAMKDSLSNIAAGLMLLFLRPYKVGDYIDCGSVSGTVRKMGLFSTELMTVDGMYIAAPNSSIFGVPIKNYSRNPLRRADISVGIAYEDSLQKGIQILHDMMKREKLICTDPAPEVLVSELADSSVNLTLRFWTATENYWEVYWRIKAGLKHTIESAGLNIPFPQRSISFSSPLPVSLSSAPDAVKTIPATTTPSRTSSEDKDAPPAATPLSVEDPQEE